MDAKKKTTDQTGSDRISSLPTPLLLSILSLIPTKEAVQSSVFSKRWQNLWISLPGLNMDDRHFPLSKKSVKRNAKFMKFVDRVLMIRDGSDIVRFRLSCDAHTKEEKIKTWLHACMTRNVRELDLDISLGETAAFSLPHFVSSSSSLEMLKLNLGGSLLQPPFQGFGCLKTLHLVKLKFSISSLSFPASTPLESLEVENCGCGSLKEIKIEEGVLKRFEMCECSDLAETVIWVSSSHLVSFKYEGNSNFPKMLSLNHHFSLAEAVIAIPYHYYKEQRRKWRKWDCDFLLECDFLMMFLLLWSARFLSLCSTCILVLSKFKDTKAALVSSHFLIVKHLKLGKNFGHRKLKIIITSILPYFPMLEALTIERPYIYTRTETSASSCGMNHLKSVEIQNFNGYPCEIELMKYFLTNAPILEKIVLLASHTFRCHSWTQKKIIAKELLAFPRLSKNFSLLFL